MTDFNEAFSEVNREYYKQIDVEKMSHMGYCERSTNDYAVCSCVLEHRMKKLKHMYVSPEFEIPQKREAGQKLYSELDSAYAQSREFRRLTHNACCPCVEGDFGMCTCTRESRINLILNLMRSPMFNKFQTQAKKELRDM